MTDQTPFGFHAPAGLVRWVIERTRAAGETWASRRMVFLLRRIAIRALKGAPVDIDVLGADMRLHPYNNVCEKKVLFTPQFFDPEELEVLRAHLKDGFTFVDIGANIGVYALFVGAHAGPNARVLAVEPQPDIFDRLTYNIRLNPFGTVKAVNCAVADKAGDLTLFLDPRNSGESSVKIVGTAQARTIKVPAVALLDLLRDEGFERVDAVKLDVEGAEDIILEPFFRDAPASMHPRLIIVEDGSKQWQIDLPKLLQERGYRLVKRARLNLIFEKTAG